MPPADRPPGTPDRDAFAAMIIEQLRRAGEKAEITYDAQAFRLRVQGEHTNVANLNNLYGEYLRAGPAERARLVRNYVRSWFAPLKGLPEDFEDLHPDLLPSVRPRAYIELNLLRMRLQGIDHPAWPYRPLGRHLAVSLVYDLPESLVQLQQRHLDDWKVTFADALDRAVANLRGISGHRFEEAGPGVWRSPWQDNLDASRLVLPELLSGHDVEGEVVAMVPNRDTLLFTGSQDEEGLARLAELATQAYEHARSISGVALRLVGDDWQPFLPAQEHPAYERFRLLAIRSLAGDYSDQKELLDQLQEGEEDPAYIAPCTAMRDKETGAAFSYCVWAEGAHAWLPRADVVVFYSHDEENGQVLGSAPWEEVMEVAGGLLAPLDLYPERYRVRVFPSEEQLEALLS
jgi:uncharacterized protein YtpQ (UPF0354 family)